MWRWDEEEAGVELGKKTLNRFIVAASFILYNFTWNDTKIKYSLLSFIKFADSEFSFVAGGEPHVRPLVALSL